MDKKRLRQALYPLVLVILVFIVWKYRQSNAEEPIDTKTTTEVVKIEGVTMGVVSYNITYLHPEGLNLKHSIDSLLKVWNMSMSTYIPESEISRFNRDVCFIFESPYFHPVLAKSKEVFENTGGAFDPTVGPLVNAWGFGPEKAMSSDSAMVDSLLQLVGFDKLEFTQEKVCKKTAGLQLDFSAIAKGYAVDVVADFIQSHGIDNLMVEIGGEVVCRGLNPEGVAWRMGIESPAVNIEERKLFAIANLDNKAIATSGNYRNYYMQDDKIYSHTIDPTTGYPIQRNILSASVIAEDCMTADAYATAFMVLGMEGTKKVLEKVKDIEAFLIYTDEDGAVAYYATPNLEKSIEIPEGK